MKARNPAVTQATQAQIEQLQSLGWYHSLELPGGGVIQGLQSLDQLRWRVRQFPIPDDLHGKRVLDIGAWDGWFSFEMEKRGASVVAVDSAKSEKLLAGRDLLGSHVEYHVASVYDLRPSDFGRFDIVLFLGVLYHLKHPLLALERVCALCSDLACVESFVTDDDASLFAKPAMEFYETTELCGQFDNWVGPNLACVMAFCRAAGFARVSPGSVVDNRAHITCWRTWDQPAGGGPAPFVVAVENSTTAGQVFSEASDDYISVWFKVSEGSLTEGEVFPEVGGFAVRPVLLNNTGGDGWRAIVKLPPGIGAGWRDVRVRVRGSAWSNTVSIGVDIGDDERRRQGAVTDVRAEDFRIEIVADGKTWERNQVRIRPGACVSLWVRGLPGGCGRADVVVRLGDHELPSAFVSEVDPQGLRQVNALLPGGLAPGRQMLRVAARAWITPGVSVEIVG